MSTIQTPWVRVVGSAMAVLCSQVLTLGMSAERQASLSEDAREYLNMALAIVRERSIRRDAVDWSVVTAEAFEIAAGAQTPPDTYAAIRFVLASLGDDHSAFANPDEMASMNRSMATRSGDPVGALIAPGIGYVEVPQFGSFDGDVVNAFATRLQQVVRDVDQSRPCGWIVDLRDNGGGNMWAMLAGIGPILGEGEVGAFVDAGGNRSIWSYRAGVAGVVRVTGAAYTLTDEAPPVAVLISGGTASSGEAVAVAFQGRPATRTFGQPSRGLTTGTRPFFLSDGAVMNLTTTVFEDRLGRRYGGSIEPDQLVTGPDSAGTQAAQEWLMRQDRCR